MRQKQHLTVAERVAELVAEHGSYRAAGKATGIRYSFLYRLGHEERHPHDSTLLALGLAPTTAVYQRLTK